MIKQILKISSATFVAAIIAFGLLFGASLFKLMHNISGSDTARALTNTDFVRQDPEVPDTLPNDFYMLLLGVDSSEQRETGEEAQYYNGSFRSDTIIVAHINLDDKKVSMCSLERDIKTILDGYESDGYYKLNAAYALGGVDLMKDEAEQLVGVKIPYYAIIDMDGLTEIIDSFGGIEIDVEDAFFDQQLQDGIEQGGWQTLNGQQAVLYSRSRYAWAEGDFARARHQREVLKSLANKIMSGTDLFQLYDKAGAISERVATNLTLPQIFEIAAKMKGIDAEADIYSLMTPTVGEYVDGVSYQVMDDEKWEEILDMLINFIDPDAPTPEDLAAAEAANGNPRYADVDEDGYYDADADLDGLVSDDEWDEYRFDHPEVDALVMQYQQKVEAQQNENGSSEDDQD